MQRQTLLEALAERLAGVRRDHPVRVAVDGIDAAGKTTLADELVRPLEARGRPVIRASIDGFHRPRAERYARGPLSPEGYFLDSFALETLRNILLDPLGPEGSCRFRRAVFDHVTDSPVTRPVERAPEDAVLLLDGIFLQREELRTCWEYVIFVDVSFEASLERALRRDLDLLGSAAVVRERYAARYVPAQKRYLKMARPRARANAVVVNEDPARPALIWQ